MNKVNYQLILDKKIEELADTHPTLLLHSCCAPCSSYVLEYLNEFFDITVFYYNPNISPESEYITRIKEQIRLINELPAKREIKFLEGDYEPEKFYEFARDMKDEPEGGERCFKCYRMRLDKTAQKAKELGFDYFTTTLSISPLKNAAVLNEIGSEVAGKYGVDYLFSDFKKRNGYKRSCELSREYNLYRQDHCGCIYSIRDN